jgi:cytochrome c1
MKIFLTAISCLVNATISSANVSITLPEESAQYQKAKGVDLANSYCMGCHSADYVLTQKMKEVFGAPVPDDQVNGIVEYLVNTYGDPRKK